MIPLFVAIGAAVALGALWLGERTAHRRARARLAEAEERVAASRRARETFFDLVAHELRSPLSAILGYQELLEDRSFGDLGSAAEPVERIGRSARLLLTLVDGVVEFSRLEAADSRANLAAVDLRMIVPAVAEAFRSHARDRGIQAETRLPATLGSIRTDPDRLLRALDLVITAAVRHPDNAPLRLEVDAQPAALHVRVAPTAIRELEGDDDDTLRVGLRLAIARKIAERLGGGLELEEDEAGVIRALWFHVTDLP